MQTQMAKKTKKRNGFYMVGKGFVSVPAPAKAKPKKK
jgi:hypothetical protein